MAFRGKRNRGAAVIVAFLLASSGVAGSAAGAAAPRPAVPLATPPGITLQKNISDRGRNRPNSPLLFANADGMTLYYSDGGKPEESGCVESAGQNWRPALAQTPAKTAGFWSVIRCKGGPAQWAYKSKALYTFAEDSSIGEVKGEKADDKSWHKAVFEPADEIALPPEISINELPDGNGVGLVTGTGQTLYLFSQDPAKLQSECAAKECTKWRPLPAAALARAIGDFAPVRGRDGTDQWAYRGKLLFTYEGDLRRGHVHGAGVDPRWEPAFLVRYYMPPQVTLLQTPTIGPVFTADAHTLYKRDRVVHTGDGDHSVRDSDKNRGDSFIGHEISIKGCNAKCAVNWHPLLAPRDAVPSGFWELVKRPEGTQQWAYQGYPMYTFSGDSKPGDMNGHDEYDIIVGNDTEYTIAEGIGGKGSQAGLIWYAQQPEFMFPSNH